MISIKLNNGWSLEEAPYLTMFAKYGFVLRKNNKKSLIEGRNGNKFRNKRGR